jgi:chromosome partitioning protein
MPADDSPRVVAFVNSKGGVGKTTLCVNVAACLHRRHAPLNAAVKVLDCDYPQHSAADWRESGGEDKPGRVQAKAFAVDSSKRPPVEEIENPDDLKAAVDSPFRGLNATDPPFILVDGGGTLDRMLGATVHAADVVVIPVRPSPADLRAVADVVNVVKNAQEKRGGKPAAVFVVSQAVTGANLSADVREALANYDLPTLDARTGHRVAYASTLMGGGSVLDNASSKAAAEIESITAEIETLLQ